MLAITQLRAEAFRRRPDDLPKHRREPIREERAGTPDARGRHLRLSKRRRSRLAADGDRTWRCDNLRAVVGQDARRAARRRP